MEKKKEEKETKTTCVWENARTSKSRKKYLRKTKEGKEGNRNGGWKGYNNWEKKINLK